MDIECRKIANEEEKQIVFTIRRKVFIEGQDVPEDIEYDEFDKGDSADVLHFIGLVNGEPSAAGRLTIFDDYLKVERIAVLDEARGLGLGKLMVQTVLEECSRYPGRRIGGHAQLAVREFYESLGFRAVGDVFVVVRAEV